MCHREGNFRAVLSIPHLPTVLLEWRARGIFNVLGTKSIFSILVFLRHTKFYLIFPRKSSSWLIDSYLGELAFVCVIFLSEFSSNFILSIKHIKKLEYLINKDKC